MILVYNLFFHTNTHAHAHAYAHVHEQHYNTAEEARNAEASFNLGLMHYYGNDVAKPFILKQRKHKITISKCSCSGRVAEESSKSMEIIVADFLQQANRFDPRPQTKAIFLRDRIHYQPFWFDTNFNARTHGARLSTESTHSTKSAGCSTTIPP